MTYPTRDSRYQPKGSMCQSCKRMNDDCSQLPFNEYRVIEKYKINGQPLIIVRCKQFDGGSDD